MSAQLRFEVTKAEFRHGHTGLKLAFDVFDAISNPAAAPAGGFGIDSSAGTVKKYPEVAVYNSIGKRRVLEVADTDEEAAERASIIEGDYKLLEVSEWCKRYEVPLSFVEGEKL